MRISRSVFVFVSMILAAISSSGDTVKLPAPDKTGGIPLMQALNERKTERSFSPADLPDQVLSDLVWAACGVNRSSGKRTAPTAVNWQEIDLYVARKDGLFLYLPEQHALKKLSAADIRTVTGKQNFTEQAPVNLIYVADFNRMNGADKEAQDFYSATDTGFISQNVYLFCASAGLHTVVLGWVDKEGLTKAMNLNDHQRVILTQPVGFPPGHTDAPARQTRLETGTLKDGVYSGTGQGYEGIITVSTTVKDGQIADIRIVRQKESYTLTAYTDIPKQVIEKQSASGIDAVSGATVTSKGLLAAIEDSLQKAR